MFAAVTRRNIGRGAAISGQVNFVTALAEYTQRLAVEQGEAEVIEAKEVEASDSDDEAQPKIGNGASDETPE